MNNSIQFKLFTSQDTELLSEVLKLRYEAYRHRITWQQSWHDMRDQWDDRSVIVVAMLNNKIIGSLRVTVNNIKDELSYPTPYSENFISPDQYVESSRLCISPQNQGQGLWYFLAAEMIALGKRSGKKYIVGSAIDALIPTWLKVGFCRTGKRYNEEHVGGGIHEMMVLDIAKVLDGSCDENFYPILNAALNTPSFEDESVQQLLDQLISKID